MFCFENGIIQNNTPLSITNAQTRPSRETPATTQNSKFKHSDNFLLFKGPRFTRDSLIRRGSSELNKREGDYDDDNEKPDERY